MVFTENFEFACDWDKQLVTKEEIIEVLPNWKTRVLSVKVVNEQLHLILLISAYNVDEIKAWLTTYERVSNAKYSIRDTAKAMGRYILFKQRLCCHRSTRCLNTYDPVQKSRSKNTKCPANIKITLRAVKKRYQGKNKDEAPDPLMPCKINLILTHNHDH